MRSILRSGIQKQVTIVTKKEETRQYNSFLEPMQAQREILNRGKEVMIKSIRNKMHGIEEEEIDPLKDKSPRASLSQASPKSV